ncbi:GGDEF domain-containing protein [Chitiniphilus eburneus]|uniref:diguanylate cyclase n=1 Tax=Chitiniphilus eburneus TaxID=2571148 RepID=A0A4U0PKI7_9NEIS|nr:GGDEF domain-containing protein [Chitiniphilus eburneus]TJZ68611.1 GGDEF domain-containing protein [Chitiniphilus eburneus]
MLHSIALAVWIAALGWLMTILAIIGWRREKLARRQLRTAIEQRLGIDLLTGLAHRSAFLAQAEHEVNRSQRAGHALSVLLVDIDDMRALNAHYGHHGGDLALRHVGTVCRTLVRDFDVLGRFSSEEVAILLPDTRLEGARSVAERIIETVAAHQVVLEDGRRFTVRVTVGMAELASEVEDAEDLLLAADGSLKRAIERRRENETA